MKTQTQIVYDINLMMMMIRKILKNNLSEHIAKKIFEYIPKYNDYFCNLFVNIEETFWTLTRKCENPATHYSNFEYRCSFHIKTNSKNEDESEGNYDDKSESENYKKKYKQLEEGKRRKISHQ